MSKEIRITTEDNPFDPFTDFSQWYMYDIGLGYNTCARLARIAPTSDALSPEENNSIIESGIEELIKYGCISKDGKHVEYRRVYKE